MCLAARQHTGGTSIPPLLLRRTRTMTCAPRRHSAIVGRPHDRKRDTRGSRVCLETVGVREGLPPFANILGCSCFYALIGLERNVCPRIFPGHLATTRSSAFTLFVLFLGQPTEVTPGPVHYHYRVKNIYFTAYGLPSPASCDVRSYAWSSFYDHRDTP